MGFFSNLFGGDMRKELEDIKAKVAELLKEKEELIAERDSSKEYVALLEEDNAKLSKQCETCDAQQKVIEYIKRNNDLTETLADVRQQRDQLRNERNAMRKEIEAIKALLNGNEIVIDEEKSEPEVEDPLDTPRADRAGVSEYAPTEGNFKLNNEQANAIDKIMAGGNFFVTGEAGTGKSVVLKYLRDHYDGNFVVVAPTGIAAVNVGGQTIHSCFGMTLGVQDVRQVKTLKEELKQKLAALDLIIIDEISMVRADMMDMIDHKMRLAKDNDEPFGGAQLVVFGDLYQLPPIVASGAERNFIDATYCSEFFFDAPGIKAKPLTILNLKVNNRQGADKEFANILNRIRVGDIDDELLETLNECRYKVIDDDNWTGIRLMPHSQPAKDYNNFMLAKLNTPKQVYTATVSGEFDSKSYPLDYNMELRIGARVMFTRNDTNGMYYNGTMGKIVGLNSDSVDVAINEPESPNHGDIVTVYQSSWDNYVFGYEPASRTVHMYSIGTFKQIPLKLAYAITIHKSQGQTYRCPVCLDFSDHHAFAEGQTYVGISRGTSLKLLYLTDPILAKDIRVDPRVADYLAGNINTAYEILTEEVKYHGTHVSITPPSNPKKMTGTRIGSIMGVNPHTTPFETWCELCNVATDSRKNSFKDNDKFGKAKKKKGNKYQKAGQIIEPKVIDYCRGKLNGIYRTVLSPAEVYGENAAEMQHFNFFPDAGNFGGMWDAKISAVANMDDAVIEIKTTSIANKTKWYGEDGTLNQIPKYYMMQAALYAYLMGVDKFIFATAHLEGKYWNNPDSFVCDDSNIVIKEYSLREVFPDFEKEIYNYCDEWYNKYVLTGISPKPDKERDRILWQELEAVGIPVKSFGKSKPMVLLDDDDGDLADYF